MKRKKGCKCGLKSGNILMAAFLYLLLKESSHGYSLVENLKMLGIEPSSVPYSVAYRLLREMETNKFISSRWEFEESGPSRKVYSITKEGINFLKVWIKRMSNTLKIMQDLEYKIKYELEKEGTKMRICFTSDEQKGLESVLSYHFGHCPYYVIVDVKGNEVEKVESIPNEMAQEHDPGELPSYMKSLGVDVIITGGMGPRAQQYFENYGIKAITGAYGKVKDVLEEFLQSKITVKSEKTLEENVKNGEENEEIERLKKESADLRRQIAELKERVERIEKKLGD